ncbi:Guanylyl cyclase [Melia azedarach]|uniref:Guanylyl cyclase n=1 Tax=Melia azedarach TaxID=155640 RepID=A0ACC1Y912_MELAZ|nr:Guanylyl cyclase [Melia azedarach]
MWPFYFLLNKILKPEEEGQVHVSEVNPASMLECCRSEQSPSNGKCSDAVLPTAYFVEVPHINQLYSWDCGLACVLMALRTTGKCNCTIQGLADLCCTTSIWTVDLAYLLQKFNVRFSYFTITFGANPNYSVETFYKEQLPTDLVRVDMLFQKATGAGINIECRSISGVEITLMILSGKYIAIALVDQYKLSRSWMEDVIVPGFYGNESGYTGHYILICGYDAGADEFEIRDPASSRKHERIPSKRLEEARKSFGTDEDLLLISLEKSEK